MWYLKHPRKLADALLRDINVESISLSSSKYGMLGWTLPSFRLCCILRRWWWEVRPWWCFSIFLMLCAGLTQPPEGLGITKRYQLGQGHYLGEGRWRAAPPNIAVQHCLAKGSEMAKSRSASEAKNPTKNVLCQLACMLVTLSVHLHCPCAQKCCSFIHASEKQTNPTNKNPKKSQLNKLFITNESFVAFLFSAVQHIIGMYFRRQ